MKPYQKFRQQELLGFSDNQAEYKKFVSIFRVTLVRDRHMQFEQKGLLSSQDAQEVLRRLIETHGQPDREQFCIILLNTKNRIIGLNIVSTGDLSSATVHPREVLKPAILANAASLILAHNHPSGDLKPSPEDIAMTKRIIKAAKVMGITIHEHLIISMYDDSYHSFADNGLIQEAYKEAR